MGNQVTIVKNEKSGKIFTPGTKVSTDGKSYGFYVVEESHLTMEGGFIREDKRTSILTVENSLGEKLNYSEGQKISGKIIRTEASEPMFTGQEPVINPKTKAVVQRGGKNLYRKDIFTQDLNASDSLVARDAVSATEPALTSSGLAN